MQTCLHGRIFLYTYRQICLRERSILPIYKTIAIANSQNSCTFVAPKHTALTFRDYLPYYRRNLRLAFPVMLTQLGGALVGLIDSVMVGHYSTTDLAAVSFANGVFFTFMVFAMGAIMGLTPLVGFVAGKANGGTASEDDARTIAAYLRSGAVFTLLLSLAMVLILAAFIPLLGHLGQEPVVVEKAVPYYICIVLSIVPFLFFCLQKQFLEGLGNTWVAMVITLIMNLLNIGLNWVLIFGHFGFPAMGATGAGIATLISRLLMPFGFYAVLHIKREWRAYVRWERPAHNALRAQLRQLWKTGAPIGGQTVLETILFTLSFVIMGWLGKEALAAHQVANQIADFAFMLSVGVGSATTIRVSHQYGCGDLHAVRMASNASIHLILLMNTIGAGLMIGFRNQIPYLFTHDEAVAQIASTLIVFAGLFQYADGMQCVGAGMLRGLADVRRPMIHAFVAYILVALPVGLVLMFPCGMGAPGMWIGFIVGLSLAAILFHARFHRLMNELTAAHQFGF